MESAGDCEKIRMKRLFKRITALASAAALTLSLAACGGSAVSGPKNTAPTNAKPVTITVWSYYNGDQLETFSKLVDEFNATVGKEQNITVEASSQGSVNDLETNVLAAAEGKVGAAEMPNIFSAYADTCYAVDQMGLVADLSGYLTDEEKAAFPESYLTEGDFDDNGTIKIFPVAKSTELLFLNDTDWQAFADAAGVRYEDLATMEGLTAAAEKYYNWTDAQTAAQLNVNAYGVYVVEVVKGGPAEKAGLQAGDRIVSVDGTEIASKDDLGTLMQKHAAGDTLSITIAREGQMQTVNVTLGEKTASNS